MRSLFVINLKLPSEYKSWVDELTQTVVLLFTIHTLYHLTKTTQTAEAQYLGRNFWQLLVFALLGYSAYFLVVKKLIRFRYLDEAMEHVPEDSPYAISISPFAVFDHFRKWLKARL